MSATAYQRAWLQVNDPTAAPFGAYASIYAELRSIIGFRGVQLMAHHGTADEFGEKQADYLKQGRAAGLIFQLVGWLDGSDPAQQARTAAAILARTRVPRYLANAEDPFQGSEFADEGRSAAFLAALRSAGFYGDIAVNTYPGVDLDWSVWRNYGARLYVQTYHQTNLRMWPAPDAVQWATQNGWQRSRVKPVLPCFKMADGSRADVATLIADCRRAATLGFGLYYFEGAMDVAPDWFRPFADAIGPEVGNIAR